MSISCQSEICVGLCQSRAPNLAVVAAAAFAVVAASDVVTLAGVSICLKWYAIPPQYVQNFDGQLGNAQEFRTKLQGEWKQNLFPMCTKHPTKARKPSYTNTTDLIFKHFFFYTTSKLSAQMLVVAVLGSLFLSPPVLFPLPPH